MKSVEEVVRDLSGCGLQATAVKIRQYGEQVREECVQTAQEHRCSTYSELCDCGDHIAKAIRKLELP